MHHGGQNHVSLQSPASFEAAEKRSGLSQVLSSIQVEKKVKTSGNEHFQEELLQKSRVGFHVWCHPSLVNSLLVARCSEILHPIAHRISTSVIDAGFKQAVQVKRLLYAILSRVGPA